VETAPAVSIQQANNEIYYFARRVSYTFLNVFAIKMAGVFMFTTCTIALRTAILPRWVAFSGFVFGVALLVVISNWLWIALLFPLWILLVSTQILVWDRMGHR
jgi:predicted RND superfamily exporter protein